MVVFFKSMDNNTLKALIKGWTPRRITNEDNTETAKHEKDWITPRDREALGNSRVLDPIYIIVAIWNFTDYETGWTERNQFN